MAQSPTTKTPAVRIAGDIDTSQRATVQGTRPPLARAEFDSGRVPAGNRLNGITLVFNRSAAQQADLQALLAAQQDPSSSLYHHWLTPEDFAARFGVADSDLAKTQFWLEQQGFSVDNISLSKTRITFSGTVAQAEQAFATELHYYRLRGVTHYAPSTDLSFPAVLAPMVSTVANLSTFRPHPHIVRPASPPRAPNPNFTSSQTQNHFLDPDDIATIYNITPAYGAGYNGSGQSIAVVGQSSVALTDIENFQKAMGFTVKDPTEILVPNSGTAAISTGDESESDLDLEYSGGIARGATIFFVYTGNSPNYNVTDALAYAVEHRVAPIISTSYGDCETDTGQGSYNAETDVLMQAATQGQSVIAAAGDAGSTDCSGNTDQSTAEQEALAVDFPASSQYVTAMGGSEFPDADVAAANSTYWTPAPTNPASDVLSSAKSYIPEQVWNDDAAQGALASGGGGASIFTPRPSWQANVPGIPSGSFRLVPDISLSASAMNAAFLYCSSDTTVGVTGSCSNGFRDANSVYLTTAGGTSFDVPIFAGLVAIINQKTASTGQGVVASTLYQLASNSTTYASAFHDITTGSNECLAGPTLCSGAGETSFLATTGYDEASGLGSVDFYNLLTAWPGSTTAPSGSFTLTAAPATVSAGSSVTAAVTITPANGFTGTVNFTASVSPASADICFALPAASVTGTTAVSATLTVFTISSSCGGNALPGSPGARKIASFLASSGRKFPPAGTPLPATTLALASILVIAFIGFRARKPSAVTAAFLLLVALGTTFSGCSSSGSSSNTTTSSTVAAKGTYTITIVGTDSANNAITATTTATLTID